MLVSNMLMGMYENRDAMRYLGIGLTEINRAIPRNPFI